MEGSNNFPLGMMRGFGVWYDSMNFKFSAVSVEAKSASAAPGFYNKQVERKGGSPH